MAIPQVGRNRTIAGAVETRGPRSDGDYAHGRASTRKVLDALVQFLVGRVSVLDRGEWRRVPREPLRQEEVPRGAVDIRDRRVAPAVKVVEVADLEGSRC